MTIKHDYEDGEYVVYTDGLCFTDYKYKHNIPGVKLFMDNEANPKKPGVFGLTEGWWWMPHPFRMTVYNYREIDSSSFLDITNRKEIEGGNFVYLEEEMRKVGGVMPDEVYFDVTIHTEESLIYELYKDLDILETGNMVFWKNRLEAIDYIYG